MIAVGRRVYHQGGFTDPERPGFVKIICMTPSTAYGSLSPYVLKNAEGCILENSWQASKVYPSVPAIRQTYSRFDSTVIWEHPAEVHVEDGVLNDKYFAWREKLRHNPYAVRYPVGMKDRHRCIGSYVPGTETLLSYIEARKNIYVAEYYESVVSAPQFSKLLTKLRRGDNLLIIEVDGPHQESLEYYQEKYGVDDSFIVNSTMLATVDSLTIMLEDDKHPFGHGYCLAWSLLHNK
jgi:hypothetical protein